MRALAAIILGLGTAAGAWAQSPLAAEVRALATRYHEDPARIDTLRTAVTQAARSDPHVDNLLALAQIAFLYGDVRAKTSEEKLEAYEQGRQAAKRAADAAPKNARAHVWYATNAGRWGQTKGVETALELDPRFPQAYVLAGTVYYIDARFTGLRVGLARTLVGRGRIEEARRELQAALDEKTPSNVADWTLEDSGEARTLLDSLKGRS